MFWASWGKEMLVLLVRYSLVSISRLSHRDVPHPEYVKDITFLPNCITLTAYSRTSLYSENLFTMYRH